MRNELVIRGTKVFGVEVSTYGLEHGYLDYHALAEIVGDRILNNNIHAATGYENWELVVGDDFYEEDDNIYNLEVYQEYIISEKGFEFLSEYTDEVVYYNEELDLYLWAITHFGTAWDYVLTDIKLVSDASFWEREEIKLLVKDERERMLKRIGGENE